MARASHGVAEAIREEAPPGLFAISAQPALERIPLDHADRCRRERISPDGWKRADIALAFITGKTIVMDVRTTNTQCASASSAGSVTAYLRGQERAKNAKYADYYRDFRPFVIDLGGAVSEDSFGALKHIMGEAAKANAPRLHWERFDWAVRAQRRIAVAMVRTTAWIATRAPVHEAATGHGARHLRPACPGPGG